ncbi:MAG: isochorismatase family protein, partial [Aeromicrobium sp.]
FVGTDLSAWLEHRGIDTIVIAGYMTQNCDESTARDAAHRGLTVEFLSDATGTLAMANGAGALGAEELHRSVLVVLQSRFAAVGTTQAWIEAIGGGAPLERPNLFASVQVASEPRAKR